MTAPPISAFDCLSRGIANLRANPELVAVYVVQQVVVLVLTLLSVAALLLPVYLGAGGVTAWRSMPGGGPAENLEDLLVDLWLILPDLLPGLVAGLVFATLVGGAALLAGCWFGAGTFAVLRTGDRQAPGGAPADHRPFRAFDLGSFTAAANRYAWRTFWFVNLYLAYLLLALLVWTFVVILAAWCGQRLGAAAGFGVGCLGSVPFLAILLALAAWMWLGMVDLPRPQGGVRPSARRAAAVLRVRPGAVALLFGLTLAASLALGVGLMPVNTALSLLLEHSLLLWILALSVSYLLQFVGSGVVGLLLAGALVALMRGEEPILPAGAPA